MTDPRSQVAVLLALMRELEGVMQAENGLLREMRLGRLQELEAEKTALAQSYELELRRLRAEPGCLAALGAEERSLLEAEMRRFQAVARQHTERLLQARTVAEGVARVLAENTVGAAAAPAYGQAPRQGGETAGRVIAVAFDRRC